MTGNLEYTNKLINYRIIIVKKKFELRETVFKTKRELKNFHELLMNSNHMLMHGKIEHSQDSDWKNGMLWKKSSRLKNTNLASKNFLLLFKILVTFFSNVIF